MEQPDRKLVVVQAGGAPESEASGEAVGRPGKLLRLASMMRSLLDEMHRTRLDEESKLRLRDVFEHTVAELEGLLSEDLRRELGALAPRIDGLPTEPEIRVAQAQLMGWLEGLLHGIEAAVWAQFAESQAQLEEMRRRALQAHERHEQETAKGRYL